MPLEVLLRDVVDEDIPVFFEHQRDPRATEMAAFAAREREAFAADWLRLREDPAVFSKTIVVDGAPVGYVGSFARSAERHVAYWIGREWWRRGIATQALTAFLQLERTRPLRARVARHNGASIRVLEKCGFLVCGSQAAADVEELIFELR